MPVSSAQEAWGLSRAWEFGVRVLARVAAHRREESAAFPDRAADQVALDRMGGWELLRVVHQVATFRSWDSRSFLFSSAFIFIGVSANH